MLFIDLIVCSSVLAFEHFRSKDTGYFSRLHPFLQIGILAFTATFLIFGIRYGLQAFENRVVIDNKGWWCELKHSGKNMSNQNSCFVVNYDWYSNRPTLSGSVWKEKQRIGGWELQKVIEVDSSNSTFIYSYHGHTQINNVITDTLYGVTQTNFDTRTGWFLSRINGKVTFDLIPLNELVKSCGLKLKTENIQVAQQAIEKYSNGECSS